MLRHPYATVVALKRPPITAYPFYLLGEVEDEMREESRIVIDALFFGGRDSRVARYRKTVGHGQVLQLDATSLRKRVITYWMFTADREGDLRRLRQCGQSTSQETIGFRGVG